MNDNAYSSYSFQLSELEHYYGDNVHLLSDPVLLTQLARLCRKEVTQPDVTWLLRDLYEALVRIVIANELPRAPIEVKTRMFEHTARGIWTGQVLDPNTHVVTVDIARAGTLPSQIAFEALTRLLHPNNVRQDHLYMNRVTDDEGAVTGVAMSGSKIGGNAQNAVVLLPDPMGATGGSASRAVRTYKSMAGAPPLKIVTLHLIVTPEYLRRMREEHPDLIVYAIRLDRGMSDTRIMSTALGEHLDRERGLNDKHYIVPGAGGLGEVLNNSDA